MRVRWRGESGAIRSSLSFSVSGLIHATLLGLVVFGNAARDGEKPKSMYDEAIKPQEKRLVWYHLQDRLPDVAPATPARAFAKPLRATRKFEQRIVAGARDDGRPPQLVWSPAPEVAAPKPMPLPNVLAVEVKRPSRPFTAPAPAPVAATAKLPDAAPAVGALPVAPAGPNLGALRKTFTPPVSKVVATAKLPDAAPALGALPVAPAGPNLPTLKKTFTPPVSKVVATAKLPDAAPIVGTLSTAPAGPNLAAPRKAFTAPATGRPTAVASKDTELPAINGAPSTDATQLAIIGLNPAKAPDLPVTPESRSAGFSAGPVPHPDGAETDGHAAGVAVPGVTVRDGIGRQQLLAAIRPMAHVIPTGPPPAPPPMRVSAAPDPALDGRVVYTMAIQMPNITSYSGSWMVWYAAREQASGAMRAPSPLRKVDPKYIASAVADGVEGVVRLGATIRRDGHVDTVKLLRHLDDRLDRSAMESLAKWEFEPARRDGAPVDVDAVFEIPFRLAPKLSK
jgi:TonB family protein